MRSILVVGSEPLRDRYEEEIFMRLLIAEDDNDIRRALVALLQKNNYTVNEAENGTDAYVLATQGQYDGIILDIMMPGMDGMEVLGKLRSEKNNVPILLLTAKSEVEDRVKGLDAGADDYLVKPFSFQELEARIKALLRRNKETVTNQLTCDNLVLDCNTRRAKRGDADIDLTVKEYRLLEYFMTHQGVALSRITLLKDVWDKNFDTNTNIVDVYVNYLRVKIDRDFDKKLIHTVVGLGYIMNA